MPDHFEMRPRIVKEYVLRHDMSWRAMMSYIQERDSQHRDLNRKYGFMENDGTYGIGKGSYSNQAYVKAYDEIEIKYKKLYEAEGQKRDGEDRATLSLFEYLLFDNASAGALRKMRECAEKHQEERWLDFISEKAKAELEDGKANMS